MNLPKPVWKNVNEGLPTHSGIVTVYGLINIGTPHECYDKSIIRREPELPCGWTDMHGDAIGDEMLIIYWLDFN